MGWRVGCREGIHGFVQSQAKVLCPHAIHKAPGEKWILGLYQPVIKFQAWIASLGQFWAAQRSRANMASAGGIRQLARSAGNEYLLQPRQFWWRAAVLASLPPPLKPLDHGGS